MEGYWGRQSTNTRDRATAMMPRMLYDRLDELGIDFGIVYPTAGLGIPRIDDDETRRAVIRGFNIVTADYFAQAQRPADPGGGDPDAHARRGDRRARIRHQAARLQGRHVRQQHRPAIAGGQGRRPGGRRATPCCTTSSASTATTTTTRSGGNAGSSAIAPTFHTGGRGFGLRNNPRNFTFNHIGHFAAAGHAVAKALFLGGVTRRFPDLRFGFLEGGAGWGCQLFADLIEHWERRGKEGLEYMDPTKLDRKLAGAAGRQIRLRGHRRRIAQPRRLAEQGGGRARRRGPGARRLRRLQDHQEAGLARPVRDAVFLRLRGRRPDECRGVQQVQPVRRQDPRDLQLRYRPFRHARHAAWCCRRPRSWSRTG